MSEWMAVIVIIVALVIIIGNFSTFQKSAKTPLRKKSLNDLTETLPRSNKKTHTLTSINKTNGNNK
jgi:uncharacterized membrane protein YgcG